MNNLVTFENYIFEKKTTKHPFHGSLSRRERKKFIEKLKKNIVIFRYKKKDSSTRKAEGTLNPKFLPPLKGDDKFIHPEYQMIYYDLEKKSWRSFRSFNFIEIISEKPALSKREDDEEKKLKEKSEEKSKKVKKTKVVDKEDDKDGDEILKDKRKKNDD